MDPNGRTNALIPVFGAAIELLLGTRGPVSGDRELELFSGSVDEESTAVFELDEYLAWSVSHHLLHGLATQKVGGGAGFFRER